jgi:hypothetical protein
MYVPTSWATKARELKPLYYGTSYSPLCELQIERLRLYLSAVYCESSSHFQVIRIQILNLKNSRLKVRIIIIIIIYVNGDMILMHFFLFRSIVALNAALPFWKMLAFVFVSAILETSHCVVFVPLINTVLLLGAPVLPTRWVKIRRICIRSSFSQSHLYSTT